MSDSFQSLKSFVSQLAISEAQKIELLRLSNKLENEQIRLDLRAPQRQDAHGSSPLETLPSPRAR